MSVTPCFVLTTIRVFHREPRMYTTLPIYSWNLWIANNSLSHRWSAESNAFLTLIQPVLKFCLYLSCMKNRAIYKQTIHLPPHSFLAPLESFCMRLFEQRKQVVNHLWGVFRYVIRSLIVAGELLFKERSTTTSSSGHFCEKMGMWHRVQPEYSWEHNLCNPLV